MESKEWANRVLDHYGYKRRRIGCLTSSNLPIDERNGGSVYALHVTPSRSSLGYMVEFIGSIWRLSNGLLSSMDLPTSLGPSPSDVRDFSAFLFFVRTAITEQDSTDAKEFLCVIFTDLLEKMEQCLEKMEEFLVVKEDKEGEHLRQRCSQCRVILKELSAISKIYEDAEEQLWTKLNRRKVSVCYLILRYAKPNDDHE
ncbi:hypothetical protein Acr_13g0007490 [Actinidia rufa]|uniref:Uncharacterized protein n=1 Tax=Actinidia rufa TaxID=165716 RepID=A0A7J0FKV7_9ERIC|nr:hypothetical protein Acr_13g0007490 [Actinidia rufa]